MRGCNRKDKGNWKILIRGTRNWKSKEDQILIKELNKEQGKRRRRIRISCDYIGLFYI